MNFASFNNQRLIVANSSYSVGVIAREKVATFERVLWRACRRTAFLRSAEIDEPLDHPDKPVGTNYYTTLKLKF
jgi:V-type H+-transporting ATPase subunit a